MKIKLTELLQGPAYILTLFRFNLRAHHADIGRSFKLGAFMFTQNLLFFAMWLVFFGAVRDVRGWKLQEVALMYGTIATACGLALLVADGIRSLALKIEDGSIDAYLTRPCHALPMVLFSRSNAASLGDLASGPVYWFIFGGMGWTDIPALLVFSILGSIIFLSALVMIFSLAFWVPRGGRFADQLFEMLIISCTIPQHAQIFAVKLVMFTILPAGFISLVPVTLLSHFDAGLAAGLVGVAAVYATLAIAVFNAGVRRYVAQT